jgi:hypothetical protein
MKILVCPLIYGNRPMNIIDENISIAGMQSFDIKYINTEGIANAMNEGIYAFQEGEYDYLAYLANDIIEPKDWLVKKINAIESYPDAGIIASSLDIPVFDMKNDHIISNWLMNKKVIDMIGLFNESMFPYGPIDLDYCERVWVGGLKTYYCIDCVAHHVGSHATGNEYGWDKSELVGKYWKIYEDNIIAYKDGTKSIKI